MIESWKRGLHWLPVVYLAGLPCFLLLFSTVEKTRQFAEDERRLLREIESAQDANDVLAFKAARGRFEKHAAALEMNQWDTTCMQAVMWGLLLFYFRATWLITEDRVSFWETFARITIVGIPFLMVIASTGGEPDLLTLASFILPITMLIGHQQAYEKISIKTGNLQIGFQIRRTFRILYLSPIFLSFGGVTLTTLFGEMGDLLIDPGVSYICILWTLYLSYLLWLLHSRI